MKPRLLDLFCGAGGATRGYQLAGFHVTGVDINPQPFYVGDAFHQCDAMFYPLEGFDAIHASPPCQSETTMSARWRGKGGRADEHLDLLTPTLRRLHSVRTPWVVENVVGAARKMSGARILLCGSMFGLGVHRPRFFQSNTLLLAPSARGDRGDCRIGVYGDRPDGRRLNTRADGSEQRAPASLEEARDAMGMDWADWHGTKEAIPPAYTQFIGEQLMAFVGART